MAGCQGIPRGLFCRLLYISDVARVCARVLLVVVVVCFFCFCFLHTAMFLPITNIINTNMYSIETTKLNF